MVTSWENGPVVTVVPIKPVVPSVLVVTVSAMLGVVSILLNVPVVPVLPIMRILRGSLRDGGRSYFQKAGSVTGSATAASWQSNGPAVSRRILGGDERSWSAAC